MADGELVEAGQALMVLEAMKMEHTIRAPSAGEIDRIRYGVGDTNEFLVKFPGERAPRAIGAEMAAAGAGLPEVRYMTIGYDRGYAADYQLVDLTATV